MLAMARRIPDEGIAKLKQVSLKTIISMLLFAIAAYTIIGLIGDIDFEEFKQSLKDASWSLLFLTLFVGQTPRVASAYSTLGSTRANLKLKPTVVLQFATCYVNLAVPTTAGRLAITARYFQQCGSNVASALAASAVDSVSGFVVQILLFISALFATGTQLELTWPTENIAGLATMVAVCVVVYVIFQLITWAIPSVRRRIRAAYDNTHEAFRVVRDPRKLVVLFAGNLVSQLLFAFTMWLTVVAFHQDVSFAMVVMVNTAVTLFAGLLPIPGGVGVSEAGITLGLTKAGVDNDTAVAIAMSYRFVTFYLPPVWGFLSYRWMSKHNYL